MNNKNTYLGVAIVAVLAVVALGAGVAFAQAPTPNPETPFGWMMGGYDQDGYGFNMMGGRGGMMRGYTQNGEAWESMDAMHQWMTASGGMHTFVWNSLAEILGLNSDELYVEVNKGKTIIQIADELGVPRTDLVAELAAAHERTLAQAVVDGNLTQDQADSILTQMAGNYERMLDLMGAGNGMMGRFYGQQDIGGQFPPGGCHGNWNGSSASQQPRP